LPKEESLGDKGTKVGLDGFVKVGVGIGDEEKKYTRPRSLALEREPQTTL
jgi:hypothetical protein